MAAGDHVKTVGSAQHRTTATTLVITVPAGGVAAGNTVFVGVSVTGQNADVVSGVADTGGNTYTLDESEAPLNGGSADPKTYLFRGAIVTALAATETITVTLAASTNNRGKAAVADEYEGTATLDQSTSAAGTSTTPSSGNVTTTSAVETMVGVFGGGGTDAPVGDTGWTDRTEVNTAGGAGATNASVGLSEQVTTGTGTFAYSATVANSQLWRALIATYTFGAGGGGTTVTPAAVAAVAAVPGPAVLAESLVTPAAVGASGAVPTPTASAETVVTPAAVASVAAVPAPTLLAASLVTPATVGVVVAVPTPTVDTGGGATTVTPGTVAAVVAVPQSTALGEALVTPATVAAVVAVPQSIVSIPALVTPGTVAIVVTVPTATPTGGVAVSPLTVTVVTAVPKPTILGVILEIVGRQRGRFYRLGDRLALVPLGRGVKAGFGAAESWEQVSEVFVYAGAEGAASHEAAQEAVAAAWAANSGASAATLKAAIDSALQAVGFRDVGGDDLV